MRINETNPSFTNKLIHSVSPYLKQHAKNPVYWYPWGDEALARAKAEDKPILVSIGYSTCYWCHVMEREVFENLSVASLMNRTFINIKVDREEHPQLDEIYMTARQLMTHEGGWPNNVFLTPDLKPFYAGGTYGATDAYGKPGFPRLIEWLNAMWLTKRDEIEKTATDMAELLQSFLVAKQTNGVVDLKAMVGGVRDGLLKHFDTKAGGFFNAPKFPHENYLQFLLADYEHTSNAASLDMAAFTLGKMAAGGINDQVGCGFHRYAVDKDWLVPHFEKMLYTQAMLARTYTDAARLTENAYLADVAKSICDFVAGPFTDGRGAFYAAIDAETDGVEGAYYAWTSKEIESILTREETAFFIHHFGLADIPAFPGHKHPDGEVLIARLPLFEAALAQKLPYEQIAAMCGAVMNKLLAARNERKAPTIDTKIIVSWNGLMIDALAHAGKTFNHGAYINRAKRAADYVLRHAQNENGRLSRIVMNQQAMHAATLEDYAYFIKGLFTLHEATGEDRWLTSASSLLQTAEDLFEDKALGGFFTMQDEGGLPVRTKNGDDGSLPSPNAVMAANYLALARITGDPATRAKVEKLLGFFLSGNDKNMLEYTSMLAVALELNTPRIVCADGQCRIE